MGPNIYHVQPLHFGLVLQRQKRPRLPFFFLHFFSFSGFILLYNKIFRKLIYMEWKQTSSTKIYHFLSPSFDKVLYLLLRSGILSVFLCFGKHSLNKITAYAWGEFQGSRKLESHNLFEVSELTQINTCLSPCHTKRHQSFAFLWLSPSNQTPPYCILL